MGSWAELPEDLLVLTAKKITLFEDFLSFSGVCRSWRSVAINDNFKGFEQIPWLMLSDGDKPDEQQFVSLRKGGVIRTVNLPEARGKRCVETLGWLVTLAKDGDMNLLNPFTRVQINLPHVTTFKDYHRKSCYDNKSFIQKAVLSSRPEESEDYVLVVIHGNCRYLGFWRLGDESWTDVEVDVNSFLDIIFHDGLFYAVMCDSVFAFDVWGLDPTRSWIVQRAPNGRIIGSNEQPFLVESAGVLHLVMRDYRTSRFQVFKAVLSERVWAEIPSLGDYALFLGDNASVSVDAPKFTGIKANCVYLTDNFWNFPQRGGVNTGIYSLEDGSKSPCYEEESFNLICPPLWVNPSSL